MKNVTQSRIRVLGIIAVILLAFYCKKEAISLSNVQKVSIPTTVDITSVWMIDDQNGVACGGLSWETGLLFSTADGGQHWQIDDTVWHKMECVMADSSGHAYAVGQSGICCEKPFEQPWIQYRADFQWHHSCFMSNEYQGIIVSGESFGEGQVRVHGPQFFWELDTVLEFPNQLQAVWASDPKTWHTCGLGWVLRSEDGGYSWQRKSPTNDFFTDIHFPTTTTGYICGRSGTLLKTTDSGKNWETIRKGGSTKPRKQAFNALWFRSENEGWLVGEGGLFWQTKDGGHTWTTIENTPKDIDLLDVFVRNGRIWVCGTRGTMLLYDL